MNIIFPAGLLVSALGLLEVLNFLLTPLLASAGYSEAQTGLLMSAFFAGGVAIILPSGFFSDRFPIRYLSFFGFLLLGIGMILFAVSHTFVVTLLALVACGVGGNMSLTTLEVLFYKTVPQKNKGKYVSYVNGAKAVVAGAFVFLGSVFAGEFSPMVLFIGVGSVSLMFAFCSFLLPKNEVYEIKKENYMEELKNPAVRYVIILAMIFFFHGGGDNISLPWIWKEEMNLSWLEFGILSGILMGVVQIIVVIWKARDTHSTHIIRKFAVIGLVLSAVGHVWMAFSFTFWEMFWGRSLHLVGDAFFFLFLTTEIAWLYSKKTVGGQFGLYLIAIIIAGILSRLCVGSMGEFFGMRSTLFLTAFVMLAGAVWIWKGNVRFSKRGE